MPHPVVEEELELLARVSSAIARGHEPEAPAEGPIVRELEQLRELLISGAEAKDAPALHQQWDRQSALLRQLRASRGAPRVDPRSPYFAHLRLEDESGERDLCLGRATCIRDGIRIVDWRNAPISKIFYRYEQGEEFEERLGGAIRSGRVLARRTVDIHDDALSRIEAPEGIFTAEADGEWRIVARERPRLAGGEASALRAHAANAGSERRLGAVGGGARRRRDKHLPEITGLIDPEQFALITRPSAGFVVIRGTAGSGKTTVALHRIAYLAFDDPAVDSEQTLFVVFSPALRDYVAHVLPALGVEGVKTLAFRDWAHAQRRRHFPSLPAAVREDTPALVQRLKLHPALAVALAEQVRRNPGPATAPQALDDWASVLTGEPLLLEVFAREGAAAPEPAAIRRFSEGCRRSNEEVFAALAGDAEARAELDPEDDALLLRAWQLRVGPLLGPSRRPLRYRHVAVDEVQDFAPVEVQVLLDCLDDRRSLTLAGDTQQHLVDHSGFTSWGDFLERLGVPGTEVETLRVSYRSSREIVSFAMTVLGDLLEDDAPPLTTRSGPPVELFRFSDRGACVAFLGDALRDLANAEPLASVAVLTPSPEASDVYAEGLAHADLPQLRRVRQQDFCFGPGVEVTEIEQVKGLEFDYIVLVDVSHQNFPDEPAARRRLHVGATRAVHQLWLTTIGTPSPLLPGTFFTS